MYCSGSSGGKEPGPGRRPGGKCSVVRGAALRAGGAIRLRPVGGCLYPKANEKPLKSFK